MKFSIFILAAAVFAISFSSCEKELSTENGNSPTGNSGFTSSSDSNYLSKITFIDRQTGVSDTGVRTFTYDNLKRVTSMDTRWTNHISASADLTNDFVNYYYTGTDTLPFKVRYIRSEGMDIDSTFRYLSYNSAGKLLRDSAMDYDHSSGGYIITKITGGLSYASNMIYGNTRSLILYDLNNLADSYTIKDTLTLSTAGNVTERRELVESDNISVPTDFYLHTLTYNNKPSPYVRVNVNNIFPVLQRQYDLSFEQMGSKNNRSSVKEEFFSNGVSYGVYFSDISNGYTYRSDGMPVQLLESDPVSTDFSKAIFEYTSF